MALLNSKIASLRLERVEDVYDPRHMIVLQDFNEQLQALRKVVAEMANQMNEVANLLGSQQTVLDLMKPYVNRMKQLGIAVGTDPSITGEHEE